MSQNYQELFDRNVIKDLTSKDLFIQLLNQKKTVYVGFDPTGPSLHIGHLVPITFLKLLAEYEVPIIAVIGGGTGMIGDPSGKKNERQLLDEATLKGYADSCGNQLKKLLKNYKNVKVINNYDWLSKLSLIDYLRDYGKMYSVSYMLAKDVVSSRLEAGLSYTEFSYMILQGIDFANLNKNHNCYVQFGGSDQWGNITGAVELVRKLNGNEVAGGTLPLLLSSSGVKFGKSEGNAFYIDEKMTTPYSLYQYLINCSDSDVFEYMRRLTTLSLTYINNLQIEHSQHPENRVAQKSLAYEIVKIIHGKSEADHVVEVSNSLFNSTITSLPLKDIELALNSVGSISSNKINILDALIELKVVAGKKAGRELISQKAISVNDQLVTDESFEILSANGIQKKLSIIKKGKKNYYLVRHS
jgi:tyrosyl-tRNA synthetase